MNVLARRLEPLTEPVYALLRLFAGLMFAFHGAQKLFGLWFPMHVAPFTQMWVGGVLELSCGVALALGLATRLAAFLASGEMAVAYVQFHWKLALGAKVLPGLNKGELAVVYAWLFLFVACRGAGAFSLDARLARAGAMDPAGGAG